MTTAEYLRTPETVAPQELIYGVLRVAESPTVSHQRVVGNLAFALMKHVRERGLGEVLFAPMDVVLDYDAALVVQPDLLFVAHDRREIVRDRVYGAPDLVAEVLSPNPRIGELNERLRWFARYGARECWLVHQTLRQVVVLKLAKKVVAGQTVFVDGEAIRSGVLDGLTLSPGQLFW